MKPLKTWLQEYGVDHQNPKNIAIHKICIPSIMFSLLGLLYLIPFPMTGSTWFMKGLYSWAMVFELTAVGLYLLLSFRAAVLMVVFASFMTFGWAYLDYLGTLPLLTVALGIFIGAWGLQFCGHKIEGRKPSFLQDLQFLLIGPLWTIEKIGGKSLLYKDSK